MDIYMFFYGVLVLATAVAIVTMVLNNKIKLEVMRQVERQREREYYGTPAEELALPEDKPTKIVEEKKEEVPPTVFAYLDEFFEEG